MTHDELLAKIDNGYLSVTDENSYYKSALRAVVELHKPVEFTYTESDKETIFVACDICYINKLKETHIYLCETIQAIQEQLR